MFIQIYLYIVYVYIFICIVIYFTYAQKDHQFVKGWKANKSDFILLTVNQPNNFQNCGT